MPLTVEEERSIVLEKLDNLIQDVRDIRASHGLLEANSTLVAGEMARNVSSAVAAVGTATVLSLQADSSLSGEVGLSLVVGGPAIEFSVHNASTGSLDCTLVLSYTFV